MAKVKDEEAVAEKFVAAFLMEKEGGQMPRKPKKPCAYPGCPNLTEGRYCPDGRGKLLPSAETESVGEAGGQMDADGEMGCLQFPGG